MAIEWPRTPVFKTRAFTASDCPAHSQPSQPSMASPMPSKDASPPIVDLAKKETPRESIRTQRGAEGLTYQRGGDKSKKAPRVGRGLRFFRAQKPRPLYSRAKSL